MAGQTPTPARTPARRTLAWNLTLNQWILAVLVIACVGLVFYSYELLNTAPPPNHWPAYYAADPATKGLVEPLTGAKPYQTFVLKSWLDAKIPFVPLLAVPYLTFLVIVPLVIPLLNLKAGSYRRFLTIGLALIVSQLVLNIAYILFQTYVVRDVHAGAGIGGWLVSQVWGNDQPFNGYPSGHCTWTTIGIISLWRLRHRFPKTSWSLMAWLCLVYPATVSLRQHYLMDVYAGLFVGFAVYWAVMFLVERPMLVPRDEPALAEASPRGA
jgi:membrane-associated phospholipid phosphatase